MKKIAKQMRYEKREKKEMYIMHKSGILDEGARKDKSSMVAEGGQEAVMRELK